MLFSEQMYPTLVVLSATKPSSEKLQAVYRTPAEQAERTFHEIQCVNLLFPQSLTNIVNTAICRCLRCCVLDYLSTGTSNFLKAVLVARQLLRGKK